VDTQWLFSVEGGEDILCVGISQGEYRQIHHGEGELTFDGVTISIRDTHGEFHRLAWTSTFRLAGQVYGEKFKGWVDWKADIALAEIRVILVILPQKGDGDIYIGGMLITERHRDGAATGLQLQDLIMHYCPAFYGKQTQGGRTEGIGYEDLGSIPWFISILVSHQPQALVWQGRPFCLTCTAHPNNNLGKCAIA
jgi:hypothetical protein